MKLIFKFLVLFGILFSSPLGYATPLVEKTYKVTCLDTKFLFDYLKKEHEEQVIMAGKMGKGFVTIWFNKKKKTATYVYTDPAMAESCIILDSVETEVVDGKSGL